MSQRPPGRVPTCLTHFPALGRVDTVLLIHTTFYIVSDEGTVTSINRLEKTNNPHDGAY